MWNLASVSLAGALLLGCGTVEEAEPRSKYSTPVAS